MARMDARRMRQGMSKALDGFTLGQKAMMVVAAVGVVLGVSLFTRSGGGAPMAPLFSGLEATDASAITAGLDAQGVTYELADGGRTVLVPQADVYRLRIDMSAQGLPAGGNDGWSLIEGQGLTASAFRQRVDFQRALSGELARTIEAIDGVSAAKVNLVIPQDDVFTSDAERATASVLVMTQAGRNLGEDQVTSIVNLVASAVPGLTTDAVTVADGSGRPLWTPATEDMAAGFAMGNDATRKTMEFEQAMARRLEDLVSTVTGPGKARVQVKAVLDLDQKATTQEINAAPPTEGDAPLILNQTRNNEQYTSAEAQSGGVLGPDGEQTAPLEGGSTNYQSTSEQTNFAINRLQEEVRFAPGQVEQMSVAVAVDAEVVDDAQVAAIQNLITAAAGLDIAAGDQLQVVPIAFDTTLADEAAEDLEDVAAGNGSRDLMGMVQPVLVGLLVAVVLFMSWRSLKKAARRAELSRPVDLRELESVREAVQPVPVLAVAAARSEDQAAGEVDDRALPSGDPSPPLPEPVPEPEPILLEPIQMSLAAKTSAQYEVEIREMIEAQTDEVASVIRSWLAETKRARR